MKAFIKLPRTQTCALALTLVLTLLGGCHSGAPKSSGAPVAGNGDPYLQGREEPPAGAQASFDTGVAALRAQKYIEAEPLFKQLAEKYPHYSGPYLNLALLYAQTQKNELAEQYFKQALQVNPNNLGAYDQYGIWLRGQGRFNEAETIYLQALTRWPDHADSHLDLGVLYELYMGRLPQALEQYQRYLELTSDDKSPVHGWVAELQRRVKGAG